MKTIWKYDLPFESVITLRMPKGAKILTVQQDQKDNKPRIWALVDPKEKTEQRDFLLIGTGVPMEIPTDLDAEYIGTYQYQQGSFIGHVFELIATQP